MRTKAELTAAFRSKYGIPGGTPLEASIYDSFCRWYGVPLFQLEELEEGDGGFVVFQVCCQLYERLVRGRNPLVDVKSSHIIQALEKDFGISNRLASDFWNSIRHGLAHTGMPFKTDIHSRPLPDWQLMHGFDAISSNDSANPLNPNSGYILHSQPWKFRDRVLGLVFAEWPAFCIETQSVYGSIIQVMGPGNLASGVAGVPGSGTSPISPTAGGPLPVAPITTGVQPPTS